MLEIDVVLEEAYDDNTGQFIGSKTRRVYLEHSLVSVSKWESVFERPFLSEGKKTPDETVSYVRMMVVGEELPPDVFSLLIEKHIDAVIDYIAAKRTATTIRSQTGSERGRETITSELIYYWMVSMQIPVEFENWHLNRLITLIRVITAKNSPKKKMSMAERRNLNRQRRAQHNTRG